MIVWAIPAILQRIKVMPREDREKLLGARKELKDVPYSKTARKQPCNYFTANWVHCLRSKYIYHHDPPVRPYFAGKENILERNASAGVFFSGKGIVERKSIAAGLGQDLKTCLPAGMSAALGRYQKESPRPEREVTQVVLPDSDTDSLEGEGQALPDSDDSFDLLANLQGAEYGGAGEQSPGRAFR